MKSLLSDFFHLSNPVSSLLTSGSLRESFSINSDLTVFERFVTEILFLFVILISLGITNLFTINIIGIHVISVLCDSGGFVVGLI